ncbi:MAG: hypothetical protein J6W54_11770 [Fibrobacter sp.]|uniref:hypothetical protein n=1 Tax=Fibrobacter sp. TaxID=35828 RepID=UPI001B0E5DC3|nr:hypothetical protein [Fibrobacter sp.]MBO7061755.1 hypothetical protein [Fibrobacter sp.]
MQFGPYSLIKVLVVSIAFALAICFVGCGDDSSSGPASEGDSKTELNSEADTADVSDDADVSSSSKADEDEEVSSSSKDAEDEEISSSDEADEEEADEEAESSSSSKKSEKSSSSKKKAKSSSSSAGVEDPGVEPAKPESSPSDESLYPDLSVLNDTTLKQGCDIDKNDDVWVIPVFGQNVEKTVYIWKGDEVSVYNLLEFPLGNAKMCESLKDSYTGLFAPENDAGKAAESYCDGGTLRIIADANEPVKADRDDLYVNATILCKDDLLD